MNYTNQETQLLIQLYQENTPIEELTIKFNKSKRSIVSKLAREGVYLTKDKTTHKITKNLLISKISKKLQVDEQLVESLEKANLQAILLLDKYL